MAVNMTTPPSKPYSEDAQVHPVRASSSNVLIFNNSPLIERIVGGIFLLTMGIGAGIICLNPPFSGVFTVVYCLMMALGALFFVSVGWATLTNVEKLVIDFSQQTYELHRDGSLRVARDGTVEQEDRPLNNTGSLREVSHLCLHCYFRPSTRHSSGGYQVAVEMIWKNNQPGRFILKTDGAMFRTERLKNKLKTYAEELAARLQVPVIEDVEA